MAAKSPMQDIKPERFTWDVPLADEGPLEHLPDVPFASENYIYLGNDPNNRLAFMLHFNCWVKDPSIWREFITFYLPDGTILIHQGFGRGDCSKGPASAGARMVAHEPGKLIGLYYSGPVQHVGAGELADSPKPHVILDKFAFDLQFKGTLPYWYFPETVNTTWSNWHTEQHGLISGTLEYEGTQYEFDGVGYRDHSRGPRDLSPWRGHTWINGQFEDGSAFAIYQLWQIIDGQEVEALSECRITRGEENITAKVSQTPRLTSMANALDEYEIGLESSLGAKTLKGTPLAMSYLSVPPLYEQLMHGAGFGHREFPMVCVEQPARYELEGVTGYGWTERSFYRDDGVTDP